MTQRAGQQDRVDDDAEEAQAPLHSQRVPKAQPLGDVRVDSVGGDLSVKQAGRDLIEHHYHYDSTAPLSREHKQRYRQLLCRVDRAPQAERMIEALRGAAQGDLCRPVVFITSGCEHELLQLLDERLAQYLIPESLSGPAVGHKRLYLNTRKGRTLEERLPRIELHSAPSDARRKVPDAAQMAQDIERARQPRVYALHVYVERMSSDDAAVIRNWVSYWDEVYRAGMRGKAFVVVAFRYDESNRPPWWLFWKRLRSKRATAEKLIKELSTVSQDDQRARRVVLDELKSVSRADVEAWLDEVVAQEIHLDEDDLEARREEIASLWRAQNQLISMQELDVVKVQLLKPHEVLRG